MTLPISGETESIASLKAKPSALFAVAFSIATISEALMKEKLPADRSMPPQPARALGSWRLKGETLFCHSLNNTVLASPRFLIPLLEMNQNADGSVTVPEVLRRYMGGQERIG